MLTRSVLCALLLLVAGYADAGVYRSLDKSGNAVFSDKPTVGAEKVELDTAYRYKVRVRKVVDGDTLLLEGGDRIRLIGINTPEVKSRYSQSQPGGEVARDWLVRTLRNPTVWLQYDAQQFDKYDRRLAHVFLESGQYLNALLLEQGLAMLTLIPPNLLYADVLIQAQHSAEQKKRGIWQMPDYQPQHVRTFDAAKSYSGWQRWELTARRLFETRKYMNLLVSESLLISIPKAQLDLFPPLESYLNTPLEARGWLRKQGKQQRLYIQHPSALMVLPR
jgi:endonuclease YncB( thermonuclease family)